jgi:hypothetical protein
MVNGVRRPQNLFSPKVIQLLELPMDSILHVHQSLMHDIDVSKLYLQRIPMHYVEITDTLTDTKGLPRRKPVQAKIVSRPFFVAQKLYRFMPAPHTVVKDRSSLLIYNYQYLSSMYQYHPHPMVSWYQYWNTTKTMWDRIAAITETSSRHHFIMIDIPADLPSYSLLQMYVSKSNPAMLKIFDTQSKLDILELWKWLSPDHRDGGAMAALKTEHLDLINLVFQLADGRSSILNLGYLNSWIKGSDALTEFASVAQFPLQQIQKLMLKYLITLQALGMSGAPQSDPEAEIIEATPAEAVEVPLEGDDSGIVTQTLDQQLADIDGEIAALDLLSRKKMSQVGVQISGDDLVAVPDAIDDLSVDEISSKVYGLVPAGDVLERQLNEYAEYGGVSAAEYRKTVQDIGKYAAMRDPYGSKLSVTEAMVIPPEMLQIDTDKTTLVGPDTVLDRTMLKSSLNSFDEDYINNVLQKDMLQMVSEVQRAGVIIRRHEIEIDASALGVYENHTLELKPIDGVASTIRFRVPKIQDDGTMICNSNRYSLRKQRVD